MKYGQRETIGNSNNDTRFRARCDETGVSRDDGVAERTACDQRDHVRQRTRSPGVSGPSDTEDGFRGRIHAVEHETTTRCHLGNGIAVTRSVRSVHVTLIERVPAISRRRVVRHPPLSSPAAPFDVVYASRASNYRRRVFLITYEVWLVLNNETFALNTFY